MLATSWTYIWDGNTGIMYLRGNIESVAGAFRDIHQSGAVIRSHVSNNIQFINIVGYMIQMKKYFCVMIGCWMKHLRVINLKDDTRFKQDKGY